MLANNKLQNESDSNQIEIDKQETLQANTTTTKQHRIRKTLSFVINSNRKRAAKFCTINRMKRGRHVRHLSLNHGPKKLTTQLDQIKACEGLGVSPCLKKKAWPSVHSPGVPKSSSSDSIKLKPKQLQFVNKNYHRFHLANSCESLKRASFKRLKQKLHNHLSLNASCEELKMQTILNHDANLRNFINQKQADQEKVKQVRKN